MDREKIIFKFQKNIMQTYSGLFFNRDIHFEEALPKGPKILAVNHPTTTDPFLLPLLVDEPVYIPITAMAFEVPVFGSLLRAAGHIPVSKIESNGTAIIQNAVDKLANGKTIGIFPEGALSPAIGDFCRPRTGAARMAVLSGVPVIPVGIYLSSDAYKEKTIETENYTAVARWVFRGDYFISVGKARKYSGDITDHIAIRAISDQIMAAVIHQARNSENRMKELHKGTGQPVLQRLFNTFQTFVNWTL